MNWPLGRIGDRSDMTDYWASEQSIGIVRHVFVHVRANGFIAFLTRHPNAKELVSLDILDHFQEAGPGWQDSINEALRKVVGK
jgi:uncharacterized protein (DUF4415 family)